MSAYTPDRWIVIDLENENGEKHSRVFAGWYGGYTSGDSWKMNSGITTTEDCGEYIDFGGESGSVYRCYKNSYGMSGYMSGVLSYYVEEASKANAKIEINRDYEDMSKMWKTT